MNFALGWNSFDAAVFPFTFDYNLPVSTKDGGFPMIYPFRYWGDVLASKAKAMIQEGTLLCLCWYI
jgi:hypothetical protein